MHDMLTRHIFTSVTKRLGREEGRNLRGTCYYNLKLGKIGISGGTSSRDRSHLISDSVNIYRDANITYTSDMLTHITVHVSHEKIFKSGMEKLTGNIII